MDKDIDTVSRSGRTFTWLTRLRRLWKVMAATGSAAVVLVVLLLVSPIIAWSAYSASDAFTKTDINPVPVVSISYAPPMLELVLPLNEKRVKSVEFRYGFDGLRSKEFKAPGNLAGKGWTYISSNGSATADEMIWAYAVLRDAKDKVIKETWYTTIYTAVPRQVSCLPTHQIPGAVIFRDDFDTLNFQDWHPLVGMVNSNQGFQAYVPDERVIFVKDGKLYIKPMPTVDHPNFDEASLTTANFNLNALYNKCQMSWLRGGCSRQGSEAHIIPPVLSGRLHSVPVLRYGILEVRARIPVGDWLWPAIWLRPRNSPYKGGWPVGGEIDMMESRGNRGSWDVGMVRSAVHWGTSGSDRKAVAGRLQRPSWHDGFHTYKLVWTPEYIETLVDDQRIMYVEAGNSMYERGNLRGRNIYARGDKMAPFDHEFYLIMNVAVGGTGGTFTESRSYGSVTKPWRNRAQDPARDFWNGRGDWLPTWRGDEAALVVDWVQFRNL